MLRKREQRDGAQFLALDLPPRVWGRSMRRIQQREVRNVGTAKKSHGAVNVGQIGILGRS